jgi:hypothetical protein
MGCFYSYFHFFFFFREQMEAGYYNYLNIHAYIHSFIHSLIHFSHSQWQVKIIRQDFILAFIYFVPVVVVKRASAKVHNRHLCFLLLRDVKNLLLATNMTHSQMIS